MVKIDKITKTIEQPNVWLCHRDYRRICSLPNIDDLRIYVAANAANEVSFTFHKSSNGNDFRYWDELKDLKVVLVDGFGYFEIAVDKSVSEETTKVVTGISTETELAQTNIDGLEINGDTDRNNPENWDNSGKYIQTVLCDITDTQHSLLHRLLKKAPHWKIGEITDTITDGEEKVATNEFHRTFNFDGTNIYDALQEISEELDVVFIFNTYERSVNMYDLNSIGEDTTIFVSAQNLANDFTCSSNKDSIKNSIKIVGGDDNINAAVRAMNPNGSNYVVYVDEELKKDMSPELQTRLDEYTVLFNSCKEDYTKACEELYKAIDEIDKLENTAMPTRELDDTSASQEIAKLTKENLGVIPVEKFTSLYDTGAKRAVQTIAQISVDYRYEVSVISSSYNSTAHTWTGKFKVENPSNKEDSAISANDVTLQLSENEAGSIQAKINQILGEMVTENVDIDTFKTNLRYYCLDSLETFKGVFDACASVLVEKGYSTLSTASSAKAYFYDLYSEYIAKVHACEEEIEVRKAQIQEANLVKDEKEKIVTDYHKKLDFESFLGKALYKEFCLYRREDTYSNDNYISDGLSSSQLLQNAKKLVDAATKQLYSSSLFQTTYTANLNNLFTNPVYEPFYDHFDLFNWIHAEIDGKKIMLRLIGITFNFSSIESIEAEFSEQVRNQNGITDLESIINQASSIATNFSSTAKKANKGDVYSQEFAKLKTEGIDSATMNVRNSVNEEVVINQSGITCRSKDLNDRYTENQLRIIGSNIVFTTDNWKTTNMAIGRGIYKDEEVYGVWCDLLCGDMIVGENLSIKTNDGFFEVNNKGVKISKLSLTVTNGVNTLMIDPDDGNIFTVKKNDEKVLYFTDEGDACFKGDVYATSLTLGSNAKIDMSNVSGIDSYMEKYVSEKGYLTSDNFSISSTTTNGITKTVTTLNGVTSTTYTSADANYVLTNVGLGSDSGNYCKIDADGLLTAKNAIIYGTMYSSAGEIAGFSINSDGFSKTYNVYDITGALGDTKFNISASDHNVSLYSWDGGVQIGSFGTLYSTVKKSGEYYDQNGEKHNTYEFSDSADANRRLVHISNYGITGKKYEDNDLSQFFNIYFEEFLLNNITKGLRVSSNADQTTENSFQITDTSVIGLYSGTEYFSLNYNNGLRLTNKPIRIQKDSDNYCFLDYAGISFRNGSTRCSMSYGSLNFYKSDGSNFFDLSNFGMNLTGTSLGLQVKNSDGTNYFSITDSSIIGNYSGSKYFGLDNNGLSLWTSGVTRIAMLTNGILNMYTSSGTQFLNIWEGAINLYNTTDTSKYIHLYNSGDIQTTGAITGIYSSKERFKVNQSTLTLNYYSGDTLAYQSVLDDYALLFKNNGTTRCDLRYDHLYFYDSSSAQFFNLSSTGLTLSNCSNGLSIRNSSGNNYFKLTDSSIAGYSSASKYFGLDNNGLSLWTSSGVMRVAMTTSGQLDMRTAAGNLFLHLWEGEISLYNTTDTSRYIHIYNSGDIQATGEIKSSNSSGTNYFKIGNNYIYGYSGGSLFFQVNSGSILMFDGGYNNVAINKNGSINFYRYGDATLSIDGSTGDIWASRNIYADSNVYSNGSALYSDCKLKEDITDLDNIKSLELINSLKPIEFVYKDNNNGRKHMGFIAQNTKEIFDSLGWGNMSIYEAQVSDEIEETYYSEDIDDQYLTWTLKYTEFIAPLVCSVQELTKQNTEMSKQIETLQIEINKLKGEMTNGE